MVPSMVPQQNALHIAQEGNRRRRHLFECNELRGGLDSQEIRERSDTQDFEQC